jgi:hypothetical protein
LIIVCPHKAINFTGGPGRNEPALLAEIDFESSGVYQFRHRGIPFVTAEKHGVSQAAFLSLRMTMKRSEGGGGNA